MIHFSKISYKNFFSVGNTPIVIQLDRSPTTAIIGGNGNGKSTLIEAIHFALFGKPFRNINKPAVINSINNGHCLVEIEFSVGSSNYKIIRGLKPAKFEIYKDNNLINQDAATKDYQKYLEDTILSGMNEYVFKQVIAIGKANYVPFMQLAAAKRREVIEELLDIKIFSSMLDLMKIKMSEIKDQTKDIESSIVLSEEKLKIQEQHQLEKKRNNVAKKVELEQSLKDTENKIRALNDTIIEKQHKRTKLQDGYKNAPKISDLVRKIELQIATTKTEKQSISKTISFFDGNDSCPTCKQSIDCHHKESIVLPLKEQLESLNVTLNETTDVLVSKQNILKEYEKLGKKIQEIDNEILKAQTEITGLQKFIFSINKDLNQVVSESTADNSMVDALKDELLKLKQKKLDITETKQYYDVVTTLLKDGGIKTKIIKKYIPVMNTLINEFLLKFGLPIQFTLDEEFNEVIKSRYRDTFCYSNFSEGEKQRIDLALLFTWRAIAKSKNTVSTNLLFLDETFDSSLDGEATEELLNILTTMDKTQNIFIISHKADITDKMRSVIEFEKHGNFTKIK